jgi:hypothetical protein
MNNIKITAESVDEFKKIETKYLELHPNVREHISRAISGFNCICFEIKKNYSSTVIINVPSDIESVAINAKGVKITCKNATFTYPHESEGGYEINMHSKL